MNDARRVGFFAIVFLVLLRIAIGWQFLYEGLWKYNTLKSTKPWSAVGYLKNAQGPLRERFQHLAGGDPYELDWLDYDKVVTRWAGWKTRFTEHYEPTDEQKSALNRLVNGRKTYSVPLAGLPKGVNLSRLGYRVNDKEFKRAIKFDAKKKRLVVMGDCHLTPADRERLYRMVPKVKMSGKRLSGGTKLERQFRDAVRKVYAEQSKLSYREKLAASLRGDEERVGAIFQDVQKLKEEKIDPYKDFGSYKRFGEIDKYRTMVREFEQSLAARETQFQQDHLDYSWDELQTERVKLVGPVKALETEMMEKAEAILTPEQTAKGPVPPEMNSLQISNYLTIAGLIILGLLLIAGFFTRTAAFLGAVMVLSFYLVWPPWPGVPPAPGPEHALFVNKNLIEVIALLAIAVSSSGLWFGLDAVVRKFFRRKKGKENLVKPGSGPIPLQPPA